MTEDELKTYLDHYSREPFKKMLLPALANQPDPKKIKVFANKAPDRYAQYLIQIAKLAGYNEKLEVDLTFKPLNNLADSELRTMLRDLTIKLKQLEAIDVTPKQVDEKPAGSAESRILMESNSKPPSK
jgi:hypothetical protein